MAAYPFIIFFIIAIVYSSVGFGGGSSYLALLSLLDLPSPEVKFLALVCNLIVVGTAFPMYHLQRLIPYRKVFPLILLSIPMAYLGGTVRLADHIYFILLALSLIAASLSMLGQWQLVSINQSKQLQRPVTYLSLGGIIGFLSGLVGIGGGVFLSPVLHVIRWDTPKSISATASFFILVNSIAGLIGQGMAEVDIDSTYIAMFLAVFLGGLLGTYIGTIKLDQFKVKLVTAVLIFIIGIRILFKYI